MAQGVGKLKSKTSHGIKKEKNRHKKAQTKKGGRVIAPKKTKHLEAAKLKKGLEKAIKANIEQEITMKVKSVEPKSFRIVQASSGDVKGKQDPKSTVKAKKK